MLIYRANSSSPLAPKYSAYTAYDNNQGDPSSYLACGVLLRNGDPYSPTVMKSLGLQPAFQYGIWNRRVGYSWKGVCGTFTFDSDGPQYWSNDNNIVSMTAVIPSTMTSNFAADLVFNYALIDQSNLPSQTKFMYAHEFLSHGWVNISHETGSGTNPCNYVDNELRKLSCIVLNINGLGTTDYYDIYVSYRLAFSIFGDETFIPTNPNFDMSILGLFNTLGTNETYWSIQQPSSSYNDNQIITRNLSDLSIKYKVIPDMYLVNYIVSGYARFMYIYGWNDLRIFSPVIHFGPYSSLPNAAPSKNITVSGLAMMIEGYPHMI